MNSSFTTSLIGALAGAYAGAYAAQRIAERQKERAELSSQLRAMNAALMVSFGICNAGISLKGQHVKPLVSAYIQQKKQLAEHKRRHFEGAGPPGSPFDFQMDLRTLQMPLVPIETLRGLVYEKLVITGRPLFVVSVLAGALASLDATIARRNELIESFRNMAERGDAHLAALYFGFRNEDGNISTDYADCITALHRLTNDVIFFSQLLCEEIADFGDLQAKRYQKFDRSAATSVGRVDFEKARAAGLMPSKDEYREWLEGFPKAPDKD